jgi:hypothetical protein
MIASFLDVFNFNQLFLEQNRLFLKLDRVICN